MKLTKRQTVNIREGHARKASGLLARLEENADGRLCNNNKDPIEMTSGQIKSAEIFLKKVLPDLQSIDSTVTNIDERSGEEMKSEAIAFLIKAGMSEAEASKAIVKMAAEAVH